MEEKTITMGVCVPVPVRITVKVGEDPADDEVIKAELPPSANVDTRTVTEAMDEDDWDELARLVRA